MKKKYHIMNIYQVSPQVGYIRSGEKYYLFTSFKSQDNEHQLEAVPTIINTQIIIRVEKIFPGLVREVKTGIIFPIVNFKTSTKDKEQQFICSSYDKIHTFVCSENSALVSQEVTTLEQLQSYDHLYPDSKKLKEKLQNIIYMGRTNMGNRIAKEIYTRHQEYTQPYVEKSMQRERQLNIKKLLHQWKKEWKK